jgi:hypothetical protein
MNNEPVAIRYDFDGYGYQYMDSGSGSDWQTRVEGELLYSEAFVRQQQAEIEALKMDIHSLTYGERFAKYFNKPVAWIEPRELDMEVSTTVTKNKWDKDDIPLYTHPAKTLTDEEITEVIKKIASNNEYVYSLYEDFEGIEFSRVGIFEFARAILRKAQEK